MSVDTIYYDQLHELAQTRSELEEFNFYFLGICSNYLSTSVSLDFVVHQLPVHFASLYEVFMTNKKEIGYLARTFLTIIHYSSTEDNIREPDREMDLSLETVEERFRLWFKDFTLMKLLYPHITKAQWFYLGLFMANHPTFNLLKFFKETYLDLLVKNHRLDGHEQVEFLLSVLNSRVGEETEIQPSSSSQERMRKGNLEEEREEKLRTERSRKEFLDQIEERLSRTSSVITERTSRQRITERIPSLRKYVEKRENMSRQLKPDRENELGSPELLMQLRVTNRRDRRNPMPQPLEPMDIESNKGEDTNRESRFRRRQLGVITDKKDLNDNDEKDKEVSSSNTPVFSIGREVLSVGVICSKKLPECPVCFEDLEPEVQTTLTECKHSFHTKCLKQYLELEIDIKSFPISCPMHTCKVGISEQDIIKVLDSKYQQKFYSFTLKHFIETHSREIFSCLSPNCEYFSFIEDTTRSFYCQVCLKAFCISCKTEWHDGMSCAENIISKRSDDNDAKFFEFVNANSCTKCPNCSYYVHKVDGCNHMTCRCGYEFCYGCGSNMNDCYCDRY